MCLASAATTVVVSLRGILTSIVKRVLRSTRVAMCSGKKVSFPMPCMYEHLPEDVRPGTGTFNAETLLFNNDGGYIVSYRYFDGAGRSATAQLLHASEAAFWPDLEAQAASLFQIVPDTPGSEIAIETTANGYNEFHKLWRNAESDASEFIPVFLPWSLDPAYRKKPDEDLKLTAEEAKLKELHNLHDEQIFGGVSRKQQQLGERLPQEFPLLASEAFISSSFDSFIPPALVVKARKQRIEDDFGWGLIVGVDPAGMGSDRTNIPGGVGAGSSKKSHAGKWTPWRWPVGFKKLFAKTNRRR